ncbi:alpha/beta hydrolase family esterase [Tuwongella immobilis]|uniref:Phospholipase/carboxylesterase/thioesterase domain-containing protein n=1 Tax=Tuwongella immobilis TaxID=692036 RepID=A0A6C2YVW8_9BACT|nr:PHB depolymerase family esterase [Tuwongella immobilis]VIP05129.1 poly(3-hydroxybutyrate) depolymerase : Poly(3-hydroxybutyrate) depolymerase OS=Herbaspirillum sp. YR522 GN=PMI40_02532 PE=4 SV=1: Abhydrolase_2 [Tuwongella immobilis]VTS07614.1 poly(3-hydroxybutyrate) depolymerase : Poly(3-hydroxybutyrate) depolymerase OS=Herbaspirillum sp. YR522 GN=PMI40_02532 PE=4 SV=1: Abhydrolase_2 [Tuwongella immobilis]
MRRTFEYRGFPRSYVVSLPTNGPIPRPLLMVLHGAGATAEWMAEETRIAQVAHAAGFAVVFPEGLPPRPDKMPKFLTNPVVWDDGAPYAPPDGIQRDDVGFLRLVLDQLQSELPVDSSRIFLTGFSNGAAMSFRLAAAMPERFAGVAPVAGHCWIDPPRLAKPVPTFYQIGRDDPMIPLAGGTVQTPWRTVTNRPPIEWTLQRWAAALGCDPVPESEEREGLERRMYHGDAPGASLEAWIIGELGHHWPGGLGRLSEKYGGRFHARIDASAAIVDFFLALPIAPTR